MRKNSLGIIFLLLLAGCLAGVTVSRAEAQETASRLLVPMGGGYSDLYAGFSQAVIANARGEQVRILVLPMAYSSNSLMISEGERKVNLEDAEQRRFEIEEACKRVAPEGQTCSAVVAPIFTREDAALPSTLNLFTDDLSGFFILGGDQTVAMQIIIDTPVEARLQELYQNGALVGGTSAGCGMQSYAMLGGYEQNFAAGNSLDFGAADVWDAPDRHGLSFGVQDAIIDQHFFQRSRVGRLLNAISLPGVPHVGIGVDAYTGVQIHDETVVSDVFGLYEVAIFDAETYHAADNVRYIALPVQPDKYVISLRNVLVHLLAQGDFSYDLATRQHSLGTAAPHVERSFSAWDFPEGAGDLILSGDISKSLSSSSILKRFIELAGGGNARILIVSAGYPTGRSAQTNAGKFKDALGGVPVEIIALDKNADEPITIPENTTGVLFIGRDVSLISPVALAPLKEAWLSGIPLMADNAAASLTGSYYVNYGPTPDEPEQEELITQKAFLQGVLEIRPGLGLLNLTVEPRTLQDNRWARLFSLAHTYPDFVALGLNDGTAIEITNSKVSVLGENVIFTLDLRQAQLNSGANGGYVIANGLMDVFAPGEIVSPQTADIASAVSEIQPTPLLSTPEPVFTSTSAPSSQTSTVTLAPEPPAVTPTPLLKPSESGQSSIALTYSLLGIVLLLIITGIVVIRQRKT